MHTHALMHTDMGYFPHKVDNISHHSADRGCMNILNGIVCLSNNWWHHIFSDPQLSASLYHVTVFWRLSSIFSLAHWCCRVRSTRSMKAECAGLWRGRCLCNGGSTSVITLVDIQQLNFDISNTYISNTMDILMCFLSPNHLFFFFLIFTLSF